MEVPYLVETLFIISLLVFMVAVILIIPTIYKDQQLQKKNDQREKNEHKPHSRFKRIIKKFWHNIRKKNSTVAMYSLTGQL